MPRVECESLEDCGSGFRIQGSGFRVQGSGSSCFVLPRERLGRCRLDGFHSDEYVA